MARPKVWTEKTIAKMESEGCGRGVGSDYIPWLDVMAVSSLGRSRRVFSSKTSRVHHLLSDVEYNVFLMLEWSREVIDIREQYPLDRDLTQEVARQKGIKHPFYPGTDVPTVMTTDFFVTMHRSGAECHEAFDAKRTEDAEDERSLEKLEIVRGTLAMMDIPHHLAYHTDIPHQQVKNIDWIRDSELKPDEVEPWPGFYASLSSRMADELSRSMPKALPLAQYCSAFDANQGVEPGTGLRVARILMSNRVLKVDLAIDALNEQPMTSFQITARLGALRAMGAA
jgi:hypothetical protein